jgi:hypothetical protein
MTMTKAQQQAVNRLYTLAKYQAKREVGGDIAYRFLGPDLRRAVTADRVLNVLYTQDGEVSDATVRFLLDALINKLSDDEDFQ